MRTSISQEEISKRLEEISKLDLKKVLDSLPIHFAITDANANILYANEAAEIRTGFSLKEAVGKNPADLWGGQMPKGFYEKMWRTIKTEKKPFIAEVQNKRKDGALYWQRLYVSPIFDKKNEIRFFIAIEPDITKYKEEISLHERLLPVFQELVNSVIASDNTAAALQEIVKIICQLTEWQVGEVWMPSSDGSRLMNVFAWSKSDNEQFSEFLKITRNITFAPGVGLPGRVWENNAVEWIKDVRKESQAIFLRVQAAQKAGLSAAAGFPVLAQGKVVAVIVFFMPTPGEKDEDVVNFVSHLIQKLEVFFNNRNREQFKEQFISVLGHQTRNPLIATKWILENLLTSSGIEKTEKQKLEQVYQENQNLINLVNDLLILSRVENLALQTETVHLDKEIKNGVKMVQKKQPNIAITFENEIGPATINTIRSLALQVFLNIMHNAAEHADKEQGKVAVKLQRSEKGILFSCHNNGEPIPEEMRPRIFTKVVSTTGGAGLGLFIVKMICDYLGWQISFDTGEGDTTFYVELH
ncbi:MAG TPA: PAS domain S-box protein [Candidatus Paceibacterota bacterium]|nr:PAS domain S-box protein [Candidatus Paceibacterota bacterium]